MPQTIINDNEILEKRSNFDREKTRRKTSNGLCRAGSRLGAVQECLNLLPEVTTNPGLQVRGMTLLMGA